MLEEILPRLHRLLLRDRGLCGIRLRASEDLESPTGELHHCIGIFGEAEHGVNHENRERQRTEEHTSDLQLLMRPSYAVFSLQKQISVKKHQTLNQYN